ncbi:AraC family transcriptional regulator [Vibrio albus]|jgi:AraC-like DNA-binding protein|uniref:AraC family transcriptional regulator n=1 Tax=Vibrio albus TaxID=2200953 RepID=A0A2U3B596_9VIBR|nr:AraC family transcriptional regulator [Vibrio albus]PWI31947.1 AraC family transcriptional regulator [Vibrio albus]
MSKVTVFKHESLTTRKKDRFPATQSGILRVKKGALNIRTEDNTSLVLSAGEFIVYHSDDLKEVQSQALYESFLAEIIILEPSVFQAFCNQIPKPNQVINTENVAEKVFVFGTSHTIATTILDLLISAKEAESSDHTVEALAHALLAEIIHISPTTQTIFRKAFDQTTAQKVIRFIELNIDNEVSLEATSQFLGMSTATLKRRLAAEDLSFSQLLKVKRVNYAATKLRLTNKSIAEIAFESGFKSAAHFSTAFKGVQGMTPKEFRQQVASSRAK